VLSPVGYTLDRTVRLDLRSDLPTQSRREERNKIGGTEVGQTLDERSSDHVSSVGVGPRELGLQGV